jgi:hypothetical protein
MAALLQSQQETIQLLTNEVARMAAVIEVFQGRLNKNSSNSSKPPSSDGLKKTNSLRRPSWFQPNPPSMTRRWPTGQEPMATSLSPSNRCSS